MEVNYFTILIVYSLSTGKSLDIVMDQLGQFAVSIDGQLYNPTIDKFQTNEAIRTNEPLIHISIKDLLTEFFDNPDIDDTALSFIVLSEPEQGLIRAIRDKSVNRIDITTQDAMIKRFDIEKTSKKTTDDPTVREIKQILGLKNYQEIKFIARNNKEVIVIKKIKKVYE
jgi:hypothetical protein